MHFAFMAKSETIKELKEKFPQKDLKPVSFLFQNKRLIMGLIIRKGLLNFLEFANTFCNFYINSLGVEEYLIQIKSIFKNIKFKKIIWRKENKNKRFIKDLNLDKKKL